MRRAVPILAAVAVLWAMGGATPAHADSPWWQVQTASRPSNLWEPGGDTEIQEVKATTNVGSFAGEVEVGGEAIGCLGTGLYGAQCAETGFAPVSSAPELREMLEGPYGAGEVEVSGGPLGTAPFLVTTPGRWVTALVVKPLFIGETELGQASSKAITEDSGRLNVTLTNLGDAPLDATSTALRIEDELPEGVDAYAVEAIGGYDGQAGPVSCAVQTSSHVSCTFEGELPSYEAIEVEVLVVLEGSPPEAGEAGKVTVSGANAPRASAAQTVKVSPEPVHFGLERFEMQAEEEGGAPTIQAGEHPFQVTNTVQLNLGRASGDRQGLGTSLKVQQPAMPRNVRVTFPAGLIGTAEPVAPCDMATFLLVDALVNHCPQESAIGVASVTFFEPGTLGYSHIPQPIFALPPQHGEPARFGFMVAGDPVIIDTSADPDNEYKITGEVRNVAQVVFFYSSTITLWGTPGDPRHDSARGWNCAYLGGGKTGPCEPPATHDEAPFLRMPTSCHSALDYEAEIEPWNVPIGSVIDRKTAQGDPLLGCSKVPFDPDISSALTSKLAANPSGLDFELRLPGNGFANSAGISEAQPKKIEVALPEGVTINPSQAEGLATCSPSEYRGERFDSKPGEGCPEASKIGSVTSHTPIFDETLAGAVYVAKPYDNPFGSLIALYIVARAPERGILVKQPLEVRPDPQTGQIVTIADHAPPAPYDYFKLHFREGGRSPLITPPGCDGDPSEPGNQPFTTVARFVPYSAADPDHPAPDEVVTRTATFQIDHGTDGGACPSGPAPFNPGFEAGTLNNQAGSYSPFVMRLTRGDGEQDMGRFSFVLPPGVVPKLAGIPYCPDAAIARAASRQGAHGGAEELADPSCPAASEIGRTLAGAGVGNQLTYVPGKLYLAGPYHGDPISAVSITPAVAGPFDAGVVVVREALRLNPVTHVGEVDGSASDPIPHILKGIPLNLRDLRVYADRDQFTLNATSCEPFQASSTIWGDGTALEPLGQTPVGLSSRYQAAGCASLGFKPRLNLRLKGGTRRGAHPALKAVVTPRPGDANFAGAVVTLPHSAFLDQAHIRTICTRVQFAAGGGNGERCPKGSVYGHARAWTPLLDEPLEGPVFLRSSSHNLPDLVLALHGLVDIDLAARIDSIHGGIRSTFADVPDAPVSRFVLSMQGGRKGLIVNSTDLCAGKHRADARLSAQNGRVDKSEPLVRAQCKKAKRKGHARHHKRGGRR